MAVPIRRRDRGASLVEFALLAPLLFSLLLGLLTGGLSLSRQNSMSNAVREGSRLGATLEESGTWASAVQKRVVGLSGGDLVAQDVCVQLVKRESATSVVPRKASTCRPSVAADVPDTDDLPLGHCAVLVWAQRGSDLNVIFFQRELSLEVDAFARYERAGESGECTTT